MVVIVEIEPDVDCKVDTLFSSLPPLLLFSFSLSLLFCTLLDAFLSGCNARYNIVEWVVNYPDGLDLWRALGRNKFPEGIMHLAVLTILVVLPCQVLIFKIWLGVRLCHFLGKPYPFLQFS